MKIKNIFLLFLAFVFLTTPAFSAPPMYGGPGDQSNVAITGGTINGATIGATTPAAGAFTTLKATTGAAAGLILQSDASGNLTYTDPAANAGLSGMVNPKQMAQGVNMTYAASGSSGIVVADNDNIDFGTGNFTLVWRGSLPDWTPADFVRIFNRTGLALQIDHESNGKIRLYRDAEILSTVGNTFANNTVHEIAAVFDATALTVTFYADGLQLGDAVSTTAVDVSSASDLHIVGSATERFASTTNHAYTFNRALTAAEVLDLYRNGIKEADKWGSQSIMTSDARAFNSVNGGWQVYPNNTSTNTGDLVITYVDSANGAHTYGTFTVAAGVLSRDIRAGHKYRYTVSAKYAGGNAGPQITIGGAAIPLTTDQTTYVSEFTALSDGALNPTFLVSGLGADNVVTLFSQDFAELGAVIALEPEGIQPAPGQWLDSSSNKLHAMQPATGSSLTRTKKDFEYRWTNTWTASSAAQYIGGLNQAVLSADHFITDIITQATVTTDVKNLELGDGSAVAKFVAAFAPSATRTKQTIAAQNDGTNLKLVYTPAAVATMTVETIIRGFIWEP